MLQLEQSMPDDDAASLQTYTDIFLGLSRIDRYKLIVKAISREEMETFEFLTSFDKSWDRVQITATHGTIKMMDLLRSRHHFTADHITLWWLKERLINCRLDILEHLLKPVADGGWGVPLSLLKEGNNLLLCTIACVGRSDILRFFRTKCDFTPEDARRGNNKVLKLAAYGGAYDILEELAWHWDLTAEDARSDNNFALRTAAKNGHPAGLQVLRSCYGLTPDDARSANNCALREAAKHGQITVLEELRENWSLTTEDARDSDNEAIKVAMAGGYVEVVHHLCEDWKLEVSDLLTDGVLSCFKIASPRIIEYLISKYNLERTSITEIREVEVLVPKRS